MFKRENERIKPSKQPNKTGPIPRPKRRKPEEIGVGALAQIVLSPSSPVRQYANPFIKAPLRAGTELPGTSRRPATSNTACKLTRGLSKDCGMWDRY